MRYWLVKQNQTFAQEFKGGYLWSPKRKSNGTINPFYEFMREVAPGDVIFCFEGARIRALGIAQSQCYEAPKPEEFGSAGLNWSHIGWKVEVRYFELHEQIRTADSMAILGPLFQEQRYSPLQASGRGNQAVYLTTVNERAAAALIGLIGFEARQIVQANAVEASVFEGDIAMPDVLRWEDHIPKPSTPRRASHRQSARHWLWREEVRALQTKRRANRESLPHYRYRSHGAPYCQPRKALTRLRYAPGTP